MTHLHHDVFEFLKRLQDKSFTHIFQMKKHKSLRVDSNTCCCVPKLNSRQKKKKCGEMSLSYSYYQQTLNSIGCSSAPAVENHGEPCLSAAADILFHAPVCDSGGSPFPRMVIPLLPLQPLSVPFSHK